MPTLEASIMACVDFLTAYQNAAYAQRYKDFVAQVLRAESEAIPFENDKSRSLTVAAARYLFKLMAYKDEYEVARLYVDPAFSKRIAAMFEGDYKLQFHVAPPLFAKRDAKGHLIKQDFGGWMLPAFRLVAKFRFLRSGIFDPFSHTDERCGERALIAEYRTTIEALLPLLRPHNLQMAVAIAEVPESIRGFGYIKQASMSAVAARCAELLRQFQAGGLPGKAT